MERERIGVGKSEKNGILIKKFPLMNLSFTTGHLYMYVTLLSTYPKFNKALTANGLVDIFPLVYFSLESYPLR